jgi:hypothetical protein
VSPQGALVLVLVAILMLGGLALWLMNVPWWMVLLVIAGVGTLARRWLMRRFSPNQARQETEPRT